MYTDISPLNTSIAVPTHRTTDTKVPIEEPVLFKTRARINMFTAGINQEYIKLIVKVIGISYVTEISSNI